MAEMSTAHPLQLTFAGLAENAFQTVLGVPDPPLVDYVAGLLTRFVHIDSVYRLHDTEGRPLAEVFEMIREAEALPEEGRTRREVYRHIGDFTLFWTGLFPEALAKLRSPWCRDYFIDYCQQGKRSYKIASTCPDDDTAEESGVLWRLSERFELCAYGLSEIRKEWEQFTLPPGEAPRVIGG